MELQQPITIPPIAQKTLDKQRVTRLIVERQQGGNYVAVAELEAYSDTGTDTAPLPQVSTQDVVGVGQYVGELLQAFAAIESAVPALQTYQAAEPNRQTARAKASEVDGAAQQADKWEADGVEGVGSFVATIREQKATVDGMTPQLAAAKTPDAVDAIGAQIAVAASLAASALSEGLQVASAWYEAHKPQPEQP